MAKEPSTKLSLDMAGYGCIFFPQVERVTLFSKRELVSFYKAVGFSEARQMATRCELVFRCFRPNLRRRRKMVILKMIFRRRFFFSRVIRKDLKQDEAHEPECRHVC